MSLLIIIFSILTFASANRLSTDKISTVKEKFVDPQFFASMPLDAKLTTVSTTVNVLQLSNIKKK